VTAVRPVRPFDVWPLSGGCRPAVDLRPAVGWMADSKAQQPFKTTSH